jgi:hypothetical protein
MRRLSPLMSGHLPTFQSLDDQQEQADKRALDLYAITSSQ